ETTPKHALDAWYGEKKDYDFATKKCRPYAVCGHYKQVVWAKSYALGCGKRLCLKLTSVKWTSPVPSANLVTCQYGPAGNIIGDPLYIDGMACSMCPPERYCKESLCALEAFSRASYQSQLFVVCLLSAFVSLF
uniref:SCP domain-containing protein n=1 Tax=Biomphalaria glabrata TaxID=6526 RepID=A0A2C9KP57_BIOGL